MYRSIAISVKGGVCVALLPRSPSFRAIIPLITYNPTVRIAEGEPGTSWHLIDVKLRSILVDVLTLLLYCITDLIAVTALHYDCHRKS